MPTIGITGFALLSGALVGLSQHRFEAVTKALSPSWLRTFGKYSYGIYVYHVMVYLAGQALLEKAGVRMPLGFVAELANLAILIGITFLIAKFSYDHFEIRFLAFKHHFEPEYEDIPVQSPAALSSGNDVHVRSKSAGQG